MKVFRLDDYQYFILLRKKYSQKLFLLKAKVSPGTYAESFIKLIYSSVFESSIQPLHEYNSFYKKEYLQFKDYLFWRYGISEEILNQLSETQPGFMAIYKLPSCTYVNEDDEIFNNSVKKIFEELEGNA
jgi:hypothetical protein